MFLSSIALALIVGALAGGGIPRLADLRLRWIWLLFIALVLRVGTVLLRQNGIGDELPLNWAWVAAYLLIFGWLWANVRVPGLQVAAVGIGLNALAVMLNSGQMPIWPGAYDVAGFTSAALANDPFHFLLATGTLHVFGLSLGARMHRVLDPVWLRSLGGGIAAMGAVMWVMA